MKSQRECWEALIRGETLINPNGAEVKLNDERIIPWNFVNPKEWSIKPKETEKLYMWAVREDDSEWWRVDEYLHPEPGPKNWDQVWKIGGPYTPPEGEG